MDEYYGMPLVSVVTPSLNQAAFIEATIQSVMCQDYASIEHIVIDGGSRDGTVDVLRRYPHLRWVSEPDSGPAEAINKGWLRSRGDILSCLGSGDTLVRGAVRSVVELFRSQPGLEMVYSDCNLINENGNNTGNIVKSAPFSLHRLFLYPYICPQTVFVRRGVLLRVGMLDEKLLLSNDYDLYLRIATAGCAMRYVPRVLANYRVHRLSLGERMGQLGDRERDLVLARSWPRVNGAVQRVLCRAACRGNVGIRRHVRRGYEDYAAGKIGQAMKRVLAGIAYYPPLILEKCVFHLFCVAGGRLLMGEAAFKRLKTRFKS